MFPAKKENNYVFLTTSEVKFLDIKNYIGPGLSYDACSSLKSTFTRDEYEESLKFFKENDCTTMGDWLRVYNVADIVPFIEAFRKMAGQYYPHKIDVCKNAASIPDISMTYELNKIFGKKREA